MKHLRERVYNLEAGALICQGGGLAGAHSDNPGREVAHATWSFVQILEAAPQHDEITHGRRQWLTNETDADPAAPVGAAESAADEKQIANFGVDGAGDFPAGDPGLALPESFAIMTVAFSISAAKAFLA